MSFIEEIYEQPLVLRGLKKEFRENYFINAGNLKSFLKENTINQIIYTGMGSSLYACYIPCIYLNKQGVKAYVFESNELLHFNKNIIDEQTMIIAVSQSGDSKETVDLCKVLGHSSHTIIITNRMDGQLYQYGDIQFLLYAGSERHTATKTYTNTIAALMFVAYVIAGEKPEAFCKLDIDLEHNAEIIHDLIREEKHMEQLGQFIEESDYIALVGSGSSYCTVNHAELVFLEAGRMVCIQIYGRPIRTWSRGVNRAGFLCCHI